MVDGCSFFFSSSPTSLWWWVLQITCSPSSASLSLPLPSLSSSRDFLFFHSLHQSESFSIPFYAFLFFLLLERGSSIVVIFSLLCFCLISLSPLTDCFLPAAAAASEAHIYDLCLRLPTTTADEWFHLQPRLRRPLSFCGESSRFRKCSGKNNEVDGDGKGIVCIYQHLRLCVLCALTPSSPSLPSLPAQSCNTK